MRAIHHGIELRKLLSPFTHSGMAPVRGAVLDMKGFNALEVVVSIGNITNADAHFKIVLMHANMADMSDAFESHPRDWLMDSAKLTITSKHKNTIRSMGYVGAKRFIQLAINPSQLDAEITCEAHAILANAASAHIR